MELPLGKDLNYWKTSKAGVEGWMQKTEDLIEGIGGEITMKMSGMMNGVEAIAIAFVVNGDEYRIDWPVLRVEDKKDRTAAQRQAATMMYHDVKTRIVKIKIFSYRVAFSDWLVLENGITVGQQLRVDGDISRLAIGD